MGIREALGVALFRRYWVASLAANAAVWMQAVALGWLVYQATHSAWAVGALALTARLPTLVFSTVAGYLADRFDRRAVGIATLTAQAVVAVVLALPSTDLGDVRVLYVAAALAGTVSALGLPSTLALVGQVAGRRHRDDAIALNAAGVSIARVVGPVVAGVMLASAPAHASFAVVAAAFVLMGTVLASIPSLPPEVRARRVRLRSALGYTARNPVPRRLLIGVALFTALGSPLQELAPVLAAQLRDGPVALGMLIGEMGFGALVGSVLYTRLHRAGYPHHSAVPTATLGCAFAGLVVALSPSLMVAGIAMMGVGFFWIWVFIATNTSLQTNTPSHMLGRVLGFYQLAMIAPIALGAPIAGLAAEWVGVRISLVTSMSLLAAWGLWSLSHRLLSADGRDPSLEGDIVEDITVHTHCPAPVAVTGDIPGAARSATRDERTPSPGVIPAGS